MVTKNDPATLTLTPTPDGSHPDRKITPAQVEEIRQRWQTEPGLSKMGLAKEYGVSPSYIAKLVSGLPNFPSPKENPKPEASGQVSAGSGNGDKPKELKAFGTNVSHKKTIEVPVIVDLCYEDALRQGWVGDEGEYITQIFMLFMEYQGLTLGVMRKPNDKPNN